MHIKSMNSIFQSLTALAMVAWRIHCAKQPTSGLESEVAEREVRLPNRSLRRRLLSRLSAPSAATQAKATKSTQDFARNFKGDG